MTGDPYLTAAQEDRCAPRMRVSIPATLRASGGRAFQTMVHDLSLGGFCSSAVNRLAPDTICWITLPGLQSLQARVVWWDASLVGCAFENLLSPIVLDNVLARWQHETTLRSSI
ncbi:MAG: PilZ domain-containing protein [Sphingomonadales bacterium]|nr:PilZ domain-containing protein [Sphingomonadales bacterium]